jgi:AAA domain
VTTPQDDPFAGQPGGQVPGRLIRPRTAPSDQNGQAPAELTKYYHPLDVVPFAAFLKHTPPERDWLIPGVLARRERLILTGYEGHGKSVLLRQWAIMAALGTGWFTLGQIRPLRVMLIDLENPEELVRINSERYAARISEASAAGRFSMCYATIPEGLAIARPGDEDTELLRTVVAEQRVDLLVIGPSYKLIAGGENDNDAAKAAAMALDQIRAAGCAVLLEAHCAKTNPDGSRGRPKEPIGASVWKRWCEFGLHLGEDGRLTHWRGPRDVRQWPETMKLRRGIEWHWEVDEHPPLPPGRPQGDPGRFVDEVLAATNWLRATYPGALATERVPSQRAVIAAAKSEGKEYRRMALLEAHSRFSEECARVRQGAPETRAEP